MEIFKPDTYPNLIGTVLFAVAIFCLLVSFFESNKKHATKLFSILVVASLSLFSSHWATYFAAIFIVATAVTELEFLQTLAAIIRKDKNYFDFKKEAISKEENLRRKAEETLEEELIVADEIKPNSNDYKIDLSDLLSLSRPDLMRLSLNVEDKALNYLSNKYGEIERNVRFKKNGYMAEFDGVISNKDGSTSKIFEIKFSRNPTHASFFLMDSIKRSKSLLEKYTEITGSKAELHLIAVLSTKDALSEQQKERMFEKSREAGIFLTFLSLTDIGFEVTHEIA